MDPTCTACSTMGKVVPAAIFIVTAFQLLADGTSSLWGFGRIQTPKVLPADTASGFGGAVSCILQCVHALYMSLDAQACDRGGLMCALLLLCKYMYAQPYCMQAPAYSATGPAEPINTTGSQPPAGAAPALSQEAAALQRTTSLPVQYRFNEPYQPDKTWRAARLGRGERPAMMAPCALRPDIAPTDDGNVLFGAGAVGGEGNVQHSSQVHVACG